MLAYMPLHIFLSTWLGTSWHVLELARTAKDVVLVFGFCLALGLSWRKPWFRSLLQDKLAWLFIAYGLLTVGMALIKPTDPDAELLGVVYNLRFLLFFGYGLLLTHLLDAGHILKRSLQVVLAAAAIGVLFGIFQYAALPNDALQHVGYTRANGVLPVFLIDEKPDLERVMSTLRDPNSLGSYLIIIAPLAYVAMLAGKRPRDTYLYGGLLGATLLCLWFTFSRSAWLGMLLAAGTFVVLAESKAKTILSKHRTIVIGGVLTVLVVVGVGLAALWQTYLVQNVILHADKSTVLEDPNQLRVRFFKESVQDIVQNPLGHGPGTAGLVSVRNNRQGTILNENYYLQIGTEVGLIGLALFVAILIWVGIRLWRAQNPVARALLASFVGLALTNFLVHIWSNEAVAYTWWGLAGIVLAAAQRQQRSKSAQLRRVGR